MTTTIKSNGYNIYIGSDIEEPLNEFLSRYLNSKIFILTDEKVEKHCLNSFLENIEEVEETEVLQIESGEENKVMEVCMEVWKMLSDVGADRNSLLINLGGGVICDLGGFAASTFKRGIDYINVPTTLLSQVDASVGGKVGIDFDDLKNQIGLFSNPKSVFINPDFLATLPKKEILSGFAEMIKHSLISKGEYWDEIRSTNIDNLNNLEPLISESIKIKNQIILEDPFENNIRKALNFGHTIGHAIESFSLINNPNHLLHGEAIAIGMICESYISNKIAGLPDKQLREIVSFIKSKYNPYPIDIGADDALIGLMLHDKKNEEDLINFTLLKSIGEPSINNHPDKALIKESLSFYNREMNLKISLN